MPLSKDFYDVYHDIEYKQHWFKEYLQKEGADYRLLRQILWLLIEKFPMRYLLDSDSLIAAKNLYYQPSFITQ